MPVLTLRAFVDGSRVKFSFNFNFKLELKYETAEYRMRRGFYRSRGLTRAYESVVDVSENRFASIFTVEVRI